MKPRVAVLIPATARYTAFVPPILQSLREHFLTDCEVEPIILTDLPDKVEARTLFIPHAPWPGVTIHKFHYLCRYEQELTSFDYLYMLDADMRVVAPVGREILGDLVATRHPYFYDKQPEDFIYDRNPESTACIPIGEGSAYVMGAFFGGKRENMMAMARDRAAAIDADEAKGVVALWHDESHLNRYVFEHPDTMLLSPSYCYPEGAGMPFEPRILALDKDHAVVRSTGLQTWLIRGERLARKVAGKAKRVLRLS